MPKFTDIFIKKPVLATVVSLLILLVGIRCLQLLPLREYPKLENTVITVTTAYPGADAQLMQGFITTPLEKSVAEADGIDYLTSSSVDGTSTITANIKLGFNPQEAFTNIMAKVSEVRDQLPKASQQPIVKKSTGMSFDLLYIAYSSKSMSSEQITDYLTRVVQPKLETVQGVSKAELLGGTTFAMRIWLNPEKMAALHISPAEVSAALQSNNFQSASGKTKGEYIAIGMKAKTDVSTVADFKQIVIKNVGGRLVRLDEVAKVELGSEQYDSSVIFNGKKAVFIGIAATPTANPLTVITQVKNQLPGISRAYPPSLQANVVYDATEYIRSSLHEVIQTIAEATLIVILVIFLFLGSIRTVIIPVIAIPLSLLGVGTIMMALGYSINLLTLLAMVLAIGMVVDDAIVVVENIYRHIESGMKPYEAAIQGAREISMPVISMSITLAAVYAPIGLMSGLTGELFSEFAFTLAGAVILSGIIALTLSPMICSKVLRPSSSKNKFVHFIDRTFEKLKSFYKKRLHNSLNFRPVTVVFAIIILLTCGFFYMFSQKELAPQEDMSSLWMQATAPQSANIDYTEKFSQQLNGIFKSFPETQNYMIINGMGAPNSVIAGMMLKPWNERSRTQAEIYPELQGKVSQIAGLKTAVFPMPSLPTGGGMLPIGFVITSVGDYKAVYKAMDKIQTAAQKSGYFMFVDSDLKFNRPVVTFDINRSKAAVLGISMQDISAALGTSLSGGYINQFSMAGDSYKVIPQVSRSARMNPDEINNINVKTASGAMVPLSTIMTMKTSVQPDQLNRFQQLNSATLQGMVMPGKTMGDALNYLQNLADKTLPQGMSYDYAGQSRSFIQEGNALLLTFVFSLIIIYLVLAAQFESFRDPFIILVSVPLSLAGALLPIFLGAASINIYTQIGLITLIGLISKHGILMVEFANKLQDAGRTVREAIEEAASVRLRPVLMTTAAMVLGVMPLVLASGAGAVSRKDIGIVISCGMLIGTCFTLFVVPTMYSLMAKRRGKLKSDS